jgi:hypothetical protein
VKNNTKRFEERGSFYTKSRQLEGRRLLNSAPILFRDFVKVKKFSCTHRLTVPNNINLNSMKFTAQRFLPFFSLQTQHYLVRPPCLRTEIPALEKMLAINNNLMTGRYCYNFQQVQVLVLDTSFHPIRPNYDLGAAHLLRQLNEATEGSRSLDVLVEKEVKKLPDATHVCLLKERFYSIST